MVRAVRRRGGLVRRTRAARGHRLGPALAVALAAGLLTACGGASVPTAYDSTGIDELQIPTPSTDPDDFVGRVDNPWLPLAPGTTWRYERTRAGQRIGTSAVTVMRRGGEVAGVGVVVVLEVDRAPSGEVEATSRRSYAQDLRGNVWLLGEQIRVDGRAESSWRAGTDDARAGLVMPAEPRAGDGYVHAEVPGTETVREYVVSVGEGEGEARVPAGTWDDVLLTTVASSGGADLGERMHARGVGLVLARDADGGEATELVALTAG